VIYFDAPYSPLTIRKPRHDQMAQLMGVASPSFYETNTSLVDNVKRSMMQYVKKLQEKSDVAGEKNTEGNTEIVTAGKIKLAESAHMVANIYL